jgi:glutathione S-transferase
MIVFGPAVSPYVRKVLAFAREKGIEVEHKPSSGGAGPDPDFLAASPFRKVPAFQHGDFRVADSSAIVGYMEKVHPDPDLIPDEPKAHAQTIWFDEFGDTILAAAGIKVFFNRWVAPRIGRPQDLDVAERAETEELPPIYAYIEGVIPDSGFLVDDRLTLADLSVASPFVNLAHLGITPDAAAFPKLTAYLAAMHARPSFAALIEAEKPMFAG